MFNVANFDAIVDIQNEIISQVCSGVDEQLGELSVEKKVSACFLRGAYVPALSDSGSCFAGILE